MSWPDIPIFLRENYVSVIAFVSGSLGVWLTIRQTIWCWPVALVAVVTSIIEFFNERLYGDMALQVFYFFAGIYGWIYWNENRKKEFTVTRADTAWIPYLVAATVMQAIVYYFILQHYGGDKPVFDSVLTAASLTTTYMMTKKWVENWLIWVIVDGAYIVLYAIKDMWLFAALYFVFAAIAFYGWVSWRKQVLQKLQ